MWDDKISILAPIYKPKGDIQSCTNCCRKITYNDIRLKLESEKPEKSVLIYVPKENHRNIHT